MVYSPPYNVPLGTYVTDGIRSGPSYNGIVSAQADENNNLISGNYDRYGKGVLYSPFNTWDIVPYASTPGNIVTATAVAAAGDLTFSQDNEATTIQVVNGLRYVQFDWPRVPSITLTGANLAGALTVTIFGSDWYGFPLQHSYTIQNAGTYSITNPANTFTPVKAFYRINRVYINGAVAGGRTVAVQTSNIFGLPYALKESSYATNFSWSGFSMVDQFGSATLVAGAVTINTPAVRTESPILTAHQGLNATPPANAGTTYISARTSRRSFVITSSDNADVSTIGWAIPNAGQNLITAADPTVPSAITGDVRGLIQLPNTGETWGFVPNGVRRLVFSAYVFGADQFQNQLASGNQPQGAGTVPNLTDADLYGRPQYYTGAL